MRVVRAAADVAAAPAVLPSVAQVRHLADIARGYEGVLDAPDVSVTTATAFGALSRLDASQSSPRCSAASCATRQNAMGLMADGVGPAKLPTGGVVESLLEPGKVLGDAVTNARRRLAWSAIDDAEWTKVVNSVDGGRRRPAAARGGLRDAPVPVPERLARPGSSSPWACS